MIIDLNDKETAALARLLTTTIDGDRYPLSPHIQMLKAILAKMRPEPVREPLPPLKQLRAAARYIGQKATGGPLAVKSEPGRR